MRRLVTCGRKLGARSARPAVGRPPTPLSVLPPPPEKQNAPLVESFRSVHTNRPHSGGAAATSAGGLPDSQRGNMKPTSQEQA